MVDEFEKVALSLQKGSATGASEHVRAWKEWREMEKLSVGRADIALEARNRFANLPIFRRPLNPARQYYSIGHDPIKSLVDGWGPLADKPYPLKLNEIPKTDLSELSFLFGGVGDARHVYGTLVGLHQVHQSLNKTKRELLHVHLTLLDVHETALARDLCILMLVNDLMTTTDKITQVEIKATIFYTYVAVVMPPYCYTRLQNTMLTLIDFLSKDSFRLPSWIFITSSSKDAIIKTLEYWLTETRKTAAGILAVHQPERSKDVTNTILSGSFISDEFKDLMHNKVEKRRAQVSAAYDQFTISQMRQFGWIPSDVSDAEAKRLAATQKDQIVDGLLKVHVKGNASIRVDREYDWFKVVKAFLPPPQLWDRHPEFEKFRVFKQSFKPLSARLSNSLKDHVEGTWKVNITLIDRESLEDLNGFVREYPDLYYDPFESIRATAAFNEKYKLAHVGYNTPMPDSPAFQHISSFFDGVVEALKILKDCVKLEFHKGEMTQELSKMRFDSDHTRPTEFPRTFTRAWLSNVPDYTHGPMNMALYMLPSLQNGEGAATAANSLLNVGLWKNGDEFCHTYTLLTPDDFIRFFGFKLVSNDPFQGFIIMSNKKLPRPLSELASRDELTTWLTRVLLCILVPGTPGVQQVRARLPNNLVSFVALLLRLQEIGYPGHWLSEYLQILLSNSLVTKVLPYEGKWPIPMSEITRRGPKHPVFMYPWHAELETILASAYGGIPFGVALPPSFVRKHQDIGLFESKVTVIDPKMATTMTCYSNQDPVAGLMFYKPGDAIRPVELAMCIDFYVKGIIPYEPGNLHLLTSVELVDIPKGIIRWKMSRDRVLKMKREGWHMCAYRTDIRDTFIRPVLASQWVELDGPLPNLDFLEIEPVD
ncbi:hypothetical protein HYDPIDRAFT_130715 [Hydnomerulius pinastri MD-312]|nr:hypothetical protein HYDPIDRAFT_130715 [Hydnomerulius pinastri MD-312]